MFCESRFSCCGGRLRLYCRASKAPWVGVDEGRKETRLAPHAAHGRRGAIDRLAASNRGKGQKIGAAYRTRKGDAGGDSAGAATTIGGEDVHSREFPGYRAEGEAALAGRGKGISH
jgi:hypothetical protein